jgi:hypothetical protein
MMKNEWWAPHTAGHIRIIRWRGICCSHGIARTVIDTKPEAGDAFMTLIRAWVCGRSPEAPDLSSPQ